MLRRSKSDVGDTLWMNRNSYSFGRV